MLEETGETGKQSRNISTPVLLSPSQELFASNNNVISSQIYYW